MAQINYFSRGLSFKLKHPRKTSVWIRKTAAEEKCSIKELNYIFCSDEYLHDLNVRFLNHDTYTDIITFDNSEGGEDGLEGDIFISIDRVKENAQKLGVPFDEELHRVIIHGVLHLIGYSDKSAAAKASMRRKEDAYLSLR